MTWVHWYKQSTGDTLKLIAMVRKNTMPTYGPGFSDSRFQITYNGNISSLAIFSAVEQHEGMYHCAYMDWTESTWNGIYLSLRGKYLLYFFIQKTYIGVKEDCSGIEMSEVSLYIFVTF